MGEERFPKINIRKNINGIWNQTNDNENITVPNFAPYVIQLLEVPDNGSENNRPTIIGLTETTSYPPDDGEFYINYGTGEIEFHENQKGNNYTVNYWKKGSLVDADDINYLHELILETYRDTTAVFDYEVIISDSSAFSGILSVFDSDLRQALLTIDAHAHSWNEITNKPDLTIELVGDATGEATFTELTSGSINVTVLDDSHKHNDIDLLEEINTNRLEPTGFVNNHEDLILSFDDENLIFTLTETSSGEIVYYINGVKYTTFSEQISIDDINGLWFIYFDENGDITASQEPWVFESTAPIATVYWNTTLNKSFVSNECHGIVMDWKTHEYLHETVGSRYGKGLSGTFDDTTFSIGIGEWFDEDIKWENTDPITNCRVLYRTGGIIHWTESQTKYYHEISNILQYDNSGSLADVDNNKYVAYWIFAINGQDDKIVSIMGQRQDTTLAAARANNTYESLTLLFAAPEMKLLYRVILRRSGTDEVFIEVQDYRVTTSIAGGVAYTPTDHGTLSGLTDQDHPASAIYTNITNFNGKLSSLDDTAQKALDTLDDHEHNFGLEFVGDVEGFDGSILTDSTGIINLIIPSLDWSKLTSVPSPTITLTGAASGSVTLVEFSDGTLEVNIEHADLNNLLEDDHTQYALLVGRLDQTLKITTIQAYDSNGLTINNSDGNLIAYFDDTTKAVGIGSNDFASIFLNNKFGLYSDTNYCQMKVRSDGTGATAYANVSISSIIQTNNMWLLSHHTDRVAVRCGITLGGWTEIYSGGAANTGLLIGVNSNSPLVFGTNDTEVMRITAAGLIGIKNTNPTYPLDLFVSTSYGIRVISSVALGTGSGGAIALQSAYPTAANQRIGKLAFGTDDLTNITETAVITAWSEEAFVYATNRGTQLRFETTLLTTRSEKMRITGSGNIGFNQTTFGTSAVKVLAIGSGTAPSDSPADAVQLWSADRGGTAGKAGLHIRSEDGTSHVFSDRVGIGTVSPAFTLDVAGTGNFAGHLTPNATGSYTCGGSSYRWSYVYTERVNTSYAFEDATQTSISVSHSPTYNTGGTWYSRGLNVVYYINDGGDYAANNAGYDRGIQTSVFVRNNIGTLAEVTGIFVEYGAYGLAGADLTGTITTAYGLRISGQKVSSATITTNYGIFITGVAGTTAWGIYQNDAGIKGNYFASSIMLGGNAAVGTSGAKVLGIVNGTAPSDSPADAVQLWSADRGSTAGKAGLHIRSEDGTSHVFSDRVGIGTTTPSYEFEVNKTVSIAAASCRILQSTSTLNGTLTGNRTAIGIGVNMYNNAVLDGNSLSIYGVYSYPQNIDGYLCNSIQGITTLPTTFHTSGTVTTIYGVYAQAIHNGAGGTVTSAYGGRFNVTQTAGTITNGYGVYIDDIGGTTTWGLYQAGATNNNFFGGNVLLGGVASATSATRSLHIFNGTAPGASVTDGVVLYSADRGSTAGKAGLHIRSEDGTSHVFSDRVGIGTVSPSYLFDFVGAESIAAASKVACNYSCTFTGTLAGNYNATGVNYGTTNNAVPGANSCYVTSLQVACSNPNGYLATGIRGLYCYSYAAHTTGTLPSAVGVYGLHLQVGSGGTTTAGYAGQFIVSVSDGTVTTAYGGHFATAISGGGAIGTSYGIYIAAVAGTTKWGLYSSDANSNNYFAGNVGFGQTSFGTSAAKVLAIGSGTAPSSSPADAVQLWSADRGGTAGKAGLHIRSEDGTSHVFSDRVGIGNTTPSYTLDVTGNIRASTNITANAGTSAGGTLHYILSNTTQRIGLGLLGAETGDNAGSNFRMWLYDDSGSYLSTPFSVIRSTGYVGINTASPSYQLEVTGLTKITGNIGINANPSNLAAAGNEYAITMAKTFADATASSVKRSIDVSLTLTPDTTATVYYQGLNHIIDVPNTVAVNLDGYIQGIRSICYFRPNTTLASLYGMYVYVGTYNGGSDSSGTITALYGTYITGAKTASSTITSAYGMYITAISGTTAYGLYLGTVIGTTEWGIYQTDVSNNNYFGGNIMLGGTAQIGTSGTNTIGIKTGTTPTTAPADNIQLFSKDANAAAGKGALHVINEVGATPLVVAAIEIKTSAGDSAEVYEGKMQINSADNTFKVYAEGAWRTICSW